MVKPALTTVPRAARARSEPVKANRAGAGAASSVSAMAQRPVVGDLVAAGVQALDLGGIVGERRAVGYERRRGALALEAVEDHGRDRHQHVVELADVQL